MDKNTLYGILMIGLILIGFYWVNKPTQEQLLARQHYQDSIQNVQLMQAEKAAAEYDQEESNEIDPTDTDSAKTAKSVAMYGEFSEGALGTEKIVTLQNCLIKVDISSKGASVASVTLKNYLDYKKDTLVLFKPGDASFGIELLTQSNRTINTSNLNFKVKSLTDSSVVFSLPAGDGKSLDFVYKLPSESYMLDFDVVPNGLSDVLKSVPDLKAIWKMEIPQQEKGRKFENRYAQLYFYSPEDGYDYLSETSTDSKNVEEPLRWVAFKDQFFSSVFIADNDLISSSSLRSKLLPDSSAFLKKYEADMMLPFNDGEKMDFHFFFGPNKYQLLKSYDENRSGDDKLNLKRIVPLGAAVFRWVNQIVTIPLFDFFGSFIGNFGIIILLLTIVIKLIIFPLTYKSYLSTARMKVLRPQIEEINQRIPQDKPTERSQATMELYKKAGVNPMGGCLPMLLQMPFLIALFYFFPTAIELRGQSFLWAQDLSSYDAIVSWNTNIPFISSTFGNHISLFCLLMTITNVIYTKINMSMTDTGQMNQMPFMKYMMYFMPFMFLFIFNDYASGLSYYYFVSLLITIIQTFVIRKFFVDEEKLLQKIHENQKKPVKKSAWLSRIEEMQKQQQAMQNSQNKKR